jgi:uncharacterized paraquat-inducible protein A
VKGLSRVLDSEVPRWLARAEPTVTFACARCHHLFTAEADPSTCPKCGAEAGLERQKGVPMPIKLFGLLVVGVLVAAFSGGIITRIAG